MNEQRIKLKLELTEGYEKRFTEAYCRVLAKRDRKLTPPQIIVAGAAGKEGKHESIKR